MFGWPAWLTSGFSGNLALEICFILSIVSLYVIEPNKYHHHLENNDNDDSPNFFAIMPCLIPAELNYGTTSTKRAIL